MIVAGGGSGRPLLKGILEALILAYTSLPSSSYSSGLRRGQRTCHCYPEHEAELSPRSCNVKAAPSLGVVEQTSLSCWCLLKEYEGTGSPWISSKSEDVRGESGGVLSKLRCTSAISHCLRFIRLLSSASSRKKCACAGSAE
ncbi:hypothetical protein PHLCEN_2v4790 [Hermanssonia centrifuga]|uniref:Uncharacterized protein n=1 Tax=Hermanssonia centrifuga TaxID=98765 RepID=A0A2R6PJ77_9APHY|nr:hypothetical protein PHLCEN_2v4790 [Hermanssonia centrifuga]